MSKILHRTALITAITVITIISATIALILPLAISSEAFATSGSVTTPAVTITSYSAGARQVTYKISFSVSSTGNLTSGTGTIALIAPPGTYWPPASSSAGSPNYVIEDQTTASGSGTANQVNIADNGTVAVITVPQSINYNDSLIVKVLGTTNPIAPGSYSIGVETSSDPALVESASYTITAASQVSSPTVSLSTTSANTTGVSYVVNFSVSAGGELVGQEGTITLEAPQGTAWSSACKANGNNGGFTITDSTHPSEGGPPIACDIAGSTATITIPNTIYGSDSLTVTDSGVTNPPSASNDSITVYTSSDTSPSSTSPPYSVVPFTSVSNLSASTSTTAAGAHGVNYLISFSTSSTGELLSGQSSISMSLPGIWWPTSNMSSVVTVTDLTTGIYSIVSGGAVGPQTGETGGITITVPFTIPGGDTVEVSIQNAIIPPTATTENLMVSTSSDQAPASTPLGFTTPNAVSNVSQTSTTSGSDTVYTVQFTPSSTGLIIPNYGTVTIVSSEAITSPTYCITDTTNNNVYSYTVQTSSSASPAIMTLMIGNSQGAPNSSGTGFCPTSGSAPTTSPDIAGGDSVTVQIETASPPSTPPTLSVETSSDTVPPSQLQPPPPGTNPPSVVLTPSYSAEALATYTISFTLTGPLYGRNTNAPSTIELIFPQGTVVQGCPTGSREDFSGYCPQYSFSLTDSTTPSGSGSGVISGIGASDTVILIPVLHNLFSGDNISISIGSIQNPPAGTYNIGITTVAPTTPTPLVTSMIGSASYAITAASSVSTPTVTLSTSAANATGVTYTITFSVSSQGSLLGAANLMAQPSTITLTASAGTIWPTNQSDYYYVDQTALSPKTPLGGDGLQVSTTSDGASVGQIVLPKLVADGDTLSVVVSGVTNPPAGSNVLSVSTSSDTIPAMSNPYTTTSPNALSVTSMTASSTLASAPGVTYTLSMSTSATGHLVGGQGNIFLTASAGTVLPTSTQAYSIVDNTTPSGSGTISSVTTDGSRAVITISNSIESADSILLSISGVTNPPAVGAAPMVVWSSSDLTTTVYSSFDTTKPTSPINANMYMSSSSVDQSGVTYTINFNTSPAGALGTNASSITVVAPASTNFSSASFTVTDDTSGKSLGPSSDVSLSGGFAMVTLYVSANVAPGSTVTITISNVTNSPAPGEFTLSTSSDTSPEVVQLPSVSAPTVTSVSPSSGSTSGGYQVVVEGTNINLVTAVNFGSNAANFTISSSTELLATAPRGAPGVVDITVVNPAATSATSNVDRFTYVATPLPTTPADYFPVSPARLADTRCSNTPKPAFCASENLPTVNAALTPIPANSAEAVTVTSVDGIPSSGTTAVTLNVTLVNPAAHAGFLAVYPASSSGQAPSISNINWNTAGVNIPNLVTAEVGTNGQVDIYNGSGGGVNVTVDIEGYYSSSASSGTSYDPISPVRLADTRCSNTPKPAFCASENLPTANQALSTLGPLTHENVTVAGIDGIPSNASGVVLNITAANTDSSGFLTVWPAGKPMATVSNLNWVSGKDVANRVMVPTGAGGSVSIYNGAYKGSVNFIVDISGYYTSSGSKFQAVNPIRICDTRSSTITSYTTECSTKGHLSPGQVLSVQVAGIDGIPSSGISAVVANVTEVGSTSNGGYLSVLPGGTSVSSGNPPTISDVNWGAAGQNVANLTIAKLGTNGNIEIFNSSGDTNIIVDVMGWYS